MKIYKFDCNGRLSPAYTCDQPGDNSGEYVKKESIQTIKIGAYTISKLDEDYWRIEKKSENCIYRADIAGGDFETLLGVAFISSFKHFAFINKLKGGDDEVD